MKQCNSCKVLVEDEDSFCRKCGGSEFTPVIVIKEEQIKKREKKEKEKRPKKKRGFIRLLLFFILLAAGVAAVTIFTPANIVMYSIEKNDYENASKIYTKYVADDYEKSQEIYSKVREQALELVEQYKNEEISYEDAMGKFYGFEQSGIYGKEVANMSWEVKNLYSARETYMEAEDAFSKGDYKNAIDLYNEILNKNLGHGRDPVSRKSQAIEAYYNEIINNVQVHMDLEEYTIAKTMIEEGLSMFAGDAKLESMLKTCQSVVYNQNIQSLLNEAHEYMKNFDYIGALSCLDSYIEIYPAEVLLQQERDNCLATFEEYVLAQTTLLMENGEYRQALDYAENNKIHLKNETKLDLLEELIVDIKSHIPVKLGDMEIFDNDTVGGQWMSYTDERDIYLEDNYGNIYDHSLSVETGSLTYLVNYKYQTLKGTVACPKGKASDSFRKSATLTIYGDGCEIAKFSEFNETAAPQTFEVDISPYERVTFVWECTGDNIWHNWGYFATIFGGVFVPIPR